MNRAKSRAEQEARSVPFSGLDAADEDPSLRDLAAQFGPDGRWLSPTRSWEQDTPEKLLLLRETRSVLQEGMERLPSAPRGAQLRCCFQVRNRSSSWASTSWGSGSSGSLPSVFIVARICRR